MSVRRLAERFPIRFRRLAGSWLVAVAVALAAVPEDPTLRPGQTVTGEIRASDSVDLLTDAMRKNDRITEVRRTTLRLEVPAHGTYTLETRAYFFDSYLILRDASGAVLAEDDNSCLQFHARITIDTLEPGVIYRVEVASVEGEPGPFEVRCYEGKPPRRSVRDERAAVLEDARHGLAVLGDAFGPDHPMTANGVTRYGVTEMLSGNLESARTTLERARSINEKTFGKDHPKSAQSLVHLATVLTRLGRYAEARELYETSLAVQEKALPPAHSAIVLTIANLSTLLLRQGHYDEALPLAERTVAMRTSNLGTEHPQTLIAIVNLAGILKKLARFDEAIDLLERSLPGFEVAFGPDHPNTAVCLNNLATMYADRADFARAEPLHKRALAIREAGLGPDHPHTASSRNNLATVYRGRGDYAAARPLYERALEANLAKLGPDHPDTIATLNNLGLLLSNLGAHESAKDHYERALEARERVLGPDHPQIATSAENLASILSVLGESERAEALFRRALAIREKVQGPNHPSTGHTLGNYGVHLVRMGEFERARDLYVRNLDIQEAVSGPDHPLTASALGKLAFVLHHLGKLERAIECHRRSISIRTRALGGEHPTTSAARINLARAHLDLGETEPALEILRSALASRQAHRDRVAWSLTEAERIQLARTQRDVLHMMLSLPETVLDASASYAAVLSFKAQVLRDLRQRRGGSLHRLEPADRERVEALRRIQAELSKAVFRQGARDREAHQAELARLAAERSRLELEWARSVGRRTNDAKAPGVRELGAALPENAVALDFLVHPAYEAGRRSTTGGLSTTGGWSGDQISVFVMRPGEPVARIRLGDAEPVEQATLRFLDELVASRGVQAEPDEGPTAEDRLRELLWKPLEARVGDAELVFVSPDAFLGTLPLETLRTEDDAYLIEDHAFVYFEDMLSLVEIASRASDGASPETNAASDKPRASKRLLALGAVDYRRLGDLAWQRAAEPASGADPIEPTERLAMTGGVSSAEGGAVLRGRFAKRWTSLSATSLEMTAVAELHEEAFEDDTRLVLEGSEATEERVKYELPRSDVVHLATHGFFQPEGLPSMWRRVKQDDGKRRMVMFEEDERLVGMLPGLMSGLVLAGANKTSPADRDDGFLTAEEISLLDLSKLELVVLSACETALGKAEAGEGMLGLRRSLRQAGARTVISSLWRVGDEATSELMQEFYERLWADGQGTLEALRGAQLAMLERNLVENDGDGLPSTWGAFVLDGDWK